MKTHNEDDYCELDPTKLCDNCCKCLDKDDAYRIVRADMLLADVPNDGFGADDAAEEEDELPPDYYQGVDLPLDEEDLEEAEYDFGRNVEPLNIDPQLLAEWEAKLSDIGLGEQHGPRIHGQRKKGGRK